MQKRSWRESPVGVFGEPMPADIQCIHQGEGNAGPFEVWRLRIGPDTNVHLVRGKDGEGALVDAGPEGDETAAAIRALLKAASVAPEALNKLVVTHGHPQHAGGIGALKARFPELAVCTSRYDAKWLPSVQKAVDSEIRQLRSQLLRWGVPGGGKGGVDEALDDYRRRRTMADLPGPAVHAVNGGDVLDLAGVPFRVEEAPGHHPGAIVLVHDDGGEVFAGDNVGVDVFPAPLLAASANGSHVAAGPQLVDGLERLKEFGPKVVFPGHGGTISNPDGALDEEIHHFRGSAQRLMSRLIDEELTPWEIAGKPGPDRLISSLAVAFCYVDLLLREAAIDCRMVKGVDRYYVPM